MACLYITLNISVENIYALHPHTVASFASLGCRPKKVNKPEGQKNANKDA
ncbi:predicted protein [Sclerotinia sclerotiorum 1980 UF-70]|uniref:Uncharacterized protein n=1 Tax=Sclerotinia sclerotiorum (strain ATCC 18683 / 1980 / Ss-1) TaxID=665079 RepID=A7EML1_SCLS1|nr:predicted protein [Sclerotinia sclerotiorum 1980 UF-70]EDO04077.1 predicted protein [Sclerotinia sclerotiorum 1980 UF-70]